MNTSHKALAIAGLISLAGCAGTNPYSNTSSDNSTPNYGSSNTSRYISAYGVIDSINTVDTNSNTSGSPIGVGTVIGGVVGGLLGNQVGGGNGKTIATVAGVAGGAIVGNQIEKSRNNTNANAYRIGVRLDNNSHATFTQNNIGDMRVGDRVRIDNDRVTRY